MGVMVEHHLSGFGSRSWMEVVIERRSVVSNFSGYRKKLKELEIKGKKLV